MKFVVQFVGNKAYIHTHTHTYIHTSFYLNKVKLFLNKFVNEKTRCMGHGQKKRHESFGEKNLNYLEKLGVDGKKILKRIIKKQYVRV